MYTTIHLQEYLRGDFLSVKIGVPRGMYFYKYYPFTKVFLEELGAEIVPSPDTTKEILNSGVKFCVDDACLPVKIYHGHAEKLSKHVDYLLIPRLTSISRKEYICPKFGGLPEMVKYSVPHLPPIIDIEVNMHKSFTNLKKALYKLSTNLGVKNPIKVNNAFKTALSIHSKHKQQLMTGNIPASIYNNQHIQPKTSKYNVGIVSHPYLLYDNFVNMNLLKKLNNWNINFTSPDMIDPAIISEKCNQLSKRMFWSSAKALIGSALYMMEDSSIDGILILTAFGCGIDSIVIEYIESVFRKSYGKPFIILTLDEHTGDAGYNTRLEAFKSLLDWRCLYENNLPTYG